MAGIVCWDRCDRGLRALQASNASVYHRALGDDMHTEPGAAEQLPVAVIQTPPVAPTPPPPDAPSAAYRQHCPHPALVGQRAFKRERKVERGAKQKKKKRLVDSIHHHTYHDLGKVPDLTYLA